MTASCLYSSDFYVEFCTAVAAATSADGHRVCRSVPLVVHCMVENERTNEPGTRGVRVGIGLTTVRGSGTSGYVQGNKFNLRAPPQGRDERKEEREAGGVKRKPNQDILEHNRKREIEVKVMERRVQLEDDEYVVV